MNQGKPRVDLLPWDVMGPLPDPLAEGLRLWWLRRPGGKFDLSDDDALAVAEVMTAGLAKYDARNWELGLEFSGVFASAMRHYLKGDALDSESGLPHRWHFLCNLVFLHTFIRRGRADLDDRPGALMLGAGSGGARE